MKKIFAVLFTVVLIQNAAAQRTVTLNKEHIPRLPVDTLPTDRYDVRLVTFTDNTFKYIPTDPEKFRDPEVYGRNWDTVNLFVYRNIELRDLPEVTKIKLIEGVGEFHSPARGRVISKYGPRGKKPHNGVDIKVEHGDSIFAAFDGIVRFLRYNNGGYGNLIIIRHPNGLETYYSHLSRRGGWQPVNSSKPDRLSVTKVKPDGPTGPISTSRPVTVTRLSTRNIW